MAHVTVDQEMFTTPKSPGVNYSHVNSHELPKVVFLSEDVREPYVSAQIPWMIQKSAEGVIRLSQRNSKPLNHETPK